MWLNFHVLNRNEKDPISNMYLSKCYLKLKTAVVIFVGPM